MHDQLNAGPLGCKEPFEYRPHITVAQDLNPERAAVAYELARRRWAEYTGQRWFAVDRVVFVQNTNRKRCWTWPKPAWAFPPPGNAGSCPKRPYPRSFGERCRFNRPDVG